MFDKFGNHDHITDLRITINNILEKLTRPYVEIRRMMNKRDFPWWLYFRYSAYSYLAFQSIAYFDLWIFRFLNEYVMPANSGLYWYALWFSCWSIFPLCLIGIKRAGDRAQWIRVLSRILEDSDLLSPIDKELPIIIDDIATDEHRRVLFLGKNSIAFEKFLEAKKGLESPACTWKLNPLKTISFKGTLKLPTPLQEWSITLNLCDMKR